MKYMVKCLQLVVVTGLFLTLLTGTSPNQGSDLCLSLKNYSKDSRRLFCNAQRTGASKTPALPRH